MNTAVLLSGGTGSRISSDIPKQYVLINGHMMISHALRSLIESDGIDLIYIVAGQDWREQIISDIESLGLDDNKIMDFASPGANRQTSILNALQTIYADMKDVMMIHPDDAENTVLIHDAARPMLTRELIEACYKALPCHDGVMPVLPMKDTVYLSEDGASISGLLDRKKIYAGQAPELFRFKKYYDANLSLLPDKILCINGASEPAIMAGMDIAMIPGDERNFKVTTNDDLERFRELIEKQEQMK